MKKTKSILMIPFTYHYEEMLDYYDFRYDESENNRVTTWDTVENHRVYMPYVRTYKHTGETESDFVNSKNKDQARLDECSEFIKSGRYIEVNEVVWKPNIEFTDTLKYSHYSRGISSAKIHFASQSNGKKYEMFLTDFDELMDLKGFQGNVVEDVFTFCKRGANYGIKLSR